MLVDGAEWDQYRLIEATSLLESLSLVKRHSLGGSSGLSMHPLTHAWAKDRQDLKQQGEAWIATGCVLTFSRFNTRMWQTQGRLLLPHVQSYLDIEISKALSFSSEAAVIPILLKCGWSLVDMRQDSRLGHLLKDMFITFGKSPEQPLEESLPLYDLHASSLFNLGKIKRAMELLEHVVKIRETTLAEAHRDRLASQHALALAYRSNGQVKEAVKMLEHVVKIQESSLAENHPNRLASQHALANTYRSNGQVQEAVQMLEHVVKIEETRLAEDHPNRLASQHGLAVAYLSNGQAEEAVKMLEHVVKIQESTLVEDHPNLLSSQHWLAVAYLSNGQAEEAVKMLEHVVKIEETTLAEDHPSRLASQHALAIAYRSNGQV
jgi:tetratricopeptide (TPR) repeat protein